MVPAALRTPELINAVRRAAKAQGIPFDQLRVGSGHNSSNPNTGLPEFIAIPDEMRRKFYERSIDRTLPPPGVAERFVHGFTTSVRGAGELAANVGGFFLGAGSDDARRLTGYNAALEDAYQARRAAGGQTGFDAPRFAGEMLSGYAIGGAFPKAVSYGASTALGAAKGAIEGALTPVNDPIGRKRLSKLRKV